MALTDPELDLLREMLVDDPIDDVYLQVGEELVRRRRWADARLVLMGGVTGTGVSERAYTLLARACLEHGDLEGCLAALARMHVDPLQNAEAERIHILALERDGRIDESLNRAHEFLALIPDDVVIASVVERLEAPAPASDRRAADPFVTVERAERYVAIGRADRAVRAYRRILFRHPGDLALTARIEQLEIQPLPDQLADDLSEELVDPATVPPNPIAMPRTSLTPRAVTPRRSRPSIPVAPPPAMSLYASIRDARPVDVAEASEPTDEPDNTSRRRRRRSLIRR